MTTEKAITLTLVGLVIVIVALVLMNARDKADCSERGGAWACRADGTYTTIGTQLVPNETCACHDRR